MIKTLNETKILSYSVNIGYKTLISEVISTWSKKHPKEIEESLTIEELEKRSKDTLRAVKEGYSSILEMPVIHIQAIMPRLLTLILVSFSTGTNFLQQSLRYTIPLIKEKEEKATIIFIPETLKNKENKIVNHVEKGLKIYYKLLDSIKVPKTRKPEEDARYHLPLCLGTFISANINLSNLVHMLSLTKQNEKIPSLWKKFVLSILNNLDEELKKLAEETSKEIKLGKFFPTAYPLVTPNIVKKIEKEFEINERNEVKLLSYDLSILKYFSKEEIKRIIIEGVKEGSFPDFSNIFFEFVIKESGVSRHQIIRHRTVFQQSLSIYDAGERKEIIIPQSIKMLSKEELKEYKEYINETFNLYEELKKESEEDAIIILPSNIAFITLLRLDGYNIFNFRGFLGNRCCELAQTETQIIASLINNKINQVLENEGYKELTYITHANCFKLRKCPELLERAENCSIYQSKSFEKELFT